MELERSSSVYYVGEVGNDSLGIVADGGLFLPFRTWSDFVVFFVRGDLCDVTCLCKRLPLILGFGR